MVISKRGREKIGGMIEKSKRAGGYVDRKALSVLNGYRGFRSEKIEWFC